MKKNYLFAAVALLTVSSIAQTTTMIGPLTPIEMPALISGNNRAGSDTTGVGFNGTVDFSPVFAADGNVYSSAYPVGGYIYGVCSSPQAGVFFNRCAQGYFNNNTLAVSIDGVIVGITDIESDLTTTATSKAVVKLWTMAANKAYYGTPGAANQTNLNNPGPATSITAPIASANLLFSDMVAQSYMYVPFPTPKTVTGDFAIGFDCSTLAAGDTVGLSMDAPASDAGLHYAFINVVGKWFCVGNFFGTSATQGLDNNIGMFAVYSNATGVSEFLNSMKLTTYPNPSIEKATIEYTLEKNSTNVSLVILDPAGKKIFDNNYNSQSAGTYKVELETSNLAAGTYFYQLNANGHNFTKQLVVTK